MRHLVIAVVALVLAIALLVRALFLMEAGNFGLSVALDLVAAAVVGVGAGKIAFYRSTRVGAPQRESSGELRARHS